MKKNFSLLLLIVFCKFLFAQPLHYNGLFDTTNNKSFACYDMISNADNHFVLTIGYEENETNAGITLYKLNHELEKLEKKKYYFDDRTLLGSKIKFNSDSSKFYCVGYALINNKQLGYISIYNLNCDSLKFVFLGDTIFSWRIIDAYETENKSLIVVGGRSKFPLNSANTYDEYPLAMKIDSMGNVLWTQLYQFTNRGLNLGIQKTLDGNFLINSYTSVPGGVGVVFTPTLIKIDTLGNMLWYRKYGALDRDNNNFTNILEDDSGNLTCLTSFKNSANINDDSKNSYFFKLSSTGEIISQKILANFDKSQAISSLIKSGNNYWAAGWQGYQNTIEVYGFISKYDLEGNIIKNREYQFYEDIVGFNHLYKIVFIPQDSGFICIGYTQYVSQDSASNQHAWLVKTDKYGCIVQDCQLTGLEDKQGMQELSIFPNPSQNVFFINSSQEIKNVSVFTINGKRILQHNVNSTFAKIDLTDFSSGIYFVEVQTEKETVRKKLVKVE